MYNAIYVTRVVEHWKWKEINVTVVIVHLLRSERETEIEEIKVLSSLYM